LLGLFVIWQLLFLFLSNVLLLVPHGKPEFDEITDDLAVHGQATSVLPVQEGIEAIATVSDRWMEATGQLQGWPLFGPNFPPQAGFVAVQFRWDDGASIMVKSPFEPQDPLHYFRSPGTSALLYNYEMRFVFMPVYWPEARMGPSWWPWEKEWREAITRRVQVQWKSMRAYLRWQRNRYVSDHPDLPPPTEAILLFDSYLIPRPAEQPWNPKGPFQRPLARWRPGIEPPPGRLPIEVCTDPAKETFEWISPPE
jgi:hypothetical protein